MFEAAAQMGQRGAGGAPVASGGEGDLGAAGGNLGVLRNNPQFQQLRQMLQQQPQLLEPFLQQIAQANPQLANLITSQPEAFLQLLGEVGGEDEEGGLLPNAPMQIQITEEERQSVERLEGMGFNRDVVLQAYFACDKNEELAGTFFFFFFFSF